MAAVGLITEYNPFHNGHKFHLQKALELTKSDTSVVIMNGKDVYKRQVGRYEKEFQA